MKVMRRRSWLLVILLGVTLQVFILAGCTSESITATATSPPGEPLAVATDVITPDATTPATTTPPATPTNELTATPPDPIEPTATVTATPLVESPTVSPPATAEAPAGDLSLSSDRVFLHPVPEIYAGDPVTFYILPNVPPEVDPSDVTVRVEVRDYFTMQGAVNGRNLAGDPIALFTWAWDTTSYWGDHEVVVTLDPDDAIKNGDENPDNNEVVVDVAVLPDHTRPAAERDQRWEVSEIDCCIIRVVNGTAAHRDLQDIEVAAQAAVDQAAERLGVQPESKIDLYFIDRVFGQGGYATSNIVISYLDRNYAGGGFHEVLVHETTHILDRQFAPDRIAFLAEGLAVWAAGGHYKQENIDQRIKALRETSLYMPLPHLIDNFYEGQHEIGYIEAAGFINYLVNTYGWEETRDFYASVRPQRGQPFTAAVEQSLQRQFDISLAEAERDWMAYLDSVPRSSQAVGDLLTTVRYYDTMRDYQLEYDPTAHFLQAWLPYVQELEQRGLTTDVTRHPSDQINVTLEVMLHAVDQAIASGDFNRANVILDSVERALINDGAFIDPLGQNYSQIVSKLTELGFEVHQVDLSGNQAVVQVTEGRRLGLRAITMALMNRDWVLLN